MQSGGPGKDKGSEVRERRVRHDFGQKGESEGRSAQHDAALTVWENGKVRLRNKGVKRARHVSLIALRRK